MIQGLQQFIKRFGVLVPGVVLGIFAVVTVCSYEKPAVQVPVVAAAAASEEDTNENEAGDVMDALEEEEFDLEDGVYEGTGTGYGGSVTVEVTIKDKKITNIEILKAPGEGASFLNRAKGVIDEMISQQNVDVDVVSGATYSSRGIIEAVKNALTGEKSTSSVAAVSASSGGSAGNVGTVSENYEYTDGSYKGTAQGFGGPITVKVTIKKGKIKTVKIVSADGETKSYFSKAKKLLKTIVKKQSTNVDAISGATYSSNGIIKAVRNALEKARKSSKKTASKDSKEKTSTAKTAKTGKLPYPDGVYYGTGEGFAGPITVALTIRDKTLKSVVITESSDDDEFLSKAKKLLDDAVTKQSAGLDAVSGATYSSNGIIEAIKNALKEAKKAAKKETSDSNGASNSNGTSDSNESSDSNGMQSSDKTPEKLSEYNDGTYTGTAICMPDEDEDFDAYAIQLEIVVSADKITTVQNLKVTEGYNKGNDSFMNRAYNNLSKKIQTKGTTDEINAVSGATCSSKAILEACREAFLKAKK